MAKNKNIPVAEAEEDLFAENERLKAENEELKMQMEMLLKAPEAKQKSNSAGEVFEMEDGVKYQLLVPRMRIPGMGPLTALEVCDNAAAKEWLVKNNSGFIQKLS